MSRATAPLSLAFSACLFAGSLACQSGGGAEESAAEPAVAAATADEGIQGTFTGTLDKAGTPVEAHAITVATDADGAPQIGFWEFCNVDMVGEGPEYASAPDASCFIDLGEGNKAYGATASASYADNQLTAEVTFEDGTTWSFTGTR